MWPACANEVECGVLIVVAVAVACVWLVAGWAAFISRNPEKPHE